MRLENSIVNPLYSVLTIIPYQETPVTNKLLNQISIVFKEGGVICESYHDVKYLLSMLEDAGLIKYSALRGKIHRIKYEEKTSTN